MKNTICLKNIMHVIHDQLVGDTIRMDTVWLVMHLLCQHAWITSQEYDLCRYVYGEHLVYEVHESIIHVCIRCFFRWERHKPSKWPWKLHSMVSLYVCLSRCIYRTINAHCWKVKQRKPYVKIDSNEEHIKCVVNRKVTPYTQVTCRTKQNCC